MADLYVQPKRKTNWWIWLLLAIILIAVIYFLSKGRNKENSTVTNTTQTDTSVSADPTLSSPNGYNEWSNIDFNSPNANFSEIKDKDISVRGNDQYAIYGLGE